MRPQSFGDFVRLLRKQQRITLRRFCELHRIDPGNHSRLERGLRSPPKSPDAQVALAEQLGLEEGTDEWQLFFDLAATSVGQIPQDILDDEDLAPKLPLVFRTLRGEKVTAEQLKELAELIRRS